MYDVWVRVLRIRSHKKLWNKTPTLSNKSNKRENCPDYPSDDLHSWDIGAHRTWVFSSLDKIKDILCLSCIIMTTVGAYRDLSRPQEAPMNTLRNSESWTLAITVYCLLRSQIANLDLHKRPWLWFIIIIQLSKYVHFVG